MLTLPETVITSIRGKHGLWKKSPAPPETKPDAELNPPPTGPFLPVKLPAGTKLRSLMRSYRGSDGKEYVIPDATPDGIQHALVSLPGVGGCFITSGWIAAPPGSNSPLEDVTLTASGRVLFNIEAAKMAAHGGKVFSLKQALPVYDNGLRPKVALSTTGARFFIHPHGMQPNGSKYLFVYTVGVLEGTVSVQELTSKQQVEVKAGSAVMATMSGIHKPRPLTKGEQSYDIGCKLAVLGRDVPARLPATMKTSASTSLPGTQVNSLGMVFVPVPGTKVRMCVHETRWQDFAAYAAAVPPLPDGKPRGLAHGLWGWDDHPVTTSWDEAQAFCVWLSQKEGKKYRLPTDEEWSFAAGIGGKEKRTPQTTPAELSKNELKSYPWGDAWPPPPGCANIGDLSYNLAAPVMEDEESFRFNDYDDGFAETAPVMSFTPSKLGIYDLAGNVAEWCADWHDAQRSTRVARGTVYFDSLRQRLSSSYRKPAPPEDMTVGFRIVLQQP